MKRVKFSNLVTMSIESYKLFRQVLKILPSCKRSRSIFKILPNIYDGVLQKNRSYFFVEQLEITDCNDHFQTNHCFDVPEEIFSLNFKERLDVATFQKIFKNTGECGSVKTRILAYFMQRNSEKPFNELISCK